MDDNIGALLEMYKEERTHARHHESMRSGVANYLLALTVAILGIIANLDFRFNTFPLAILLVLLGIYGLLISIKFYERYNFHTSRASDFRRRIDELCPKSKILKMKTIGQKRHSKEFKKIKNMRLNYLWLFLYIFLIILGAGCLLAIVLGNLSGR